MSAGTLVAALSQAFAGRRVFLTGHTGFKGSWLSIWLNHLGAQVFGYALPPVGECNNFQTSGVQSLLARHDEADLADIPALDRAIDAAEPDVVLHLAAQALVRASYREPRATFATNVMGTCNVLEAVRRRGRPCVVLVITSDKCYENREQPWGYRETDAMGGHDPYSASKGLAELLTASYRNSFFPPAQLARHGIQVASARAGNVIGGGDWAADRIVPDIVQNLVQGRTISVRSPRAVRPWQHVLEPLSGYLTLAARMLTMNDPALCEGWNFGPQIEGNRTVRDLVETFLAAWGGGTWEDKSDPHQLHEANLLRLSIEKAVLQLQWQPTWGFQETIRRTATWYRHYYAHPERSTLANCLEDIACFSGTSHTEQAPLYAPRRAA